MAEPMPEGRSEFQRDRDRIVHSGAFRKLQYKTQVFVNHEGDYYRTRLTHSLEVAQITRTLSRVLRVDEDLAEAIALAHDLGHTCFGHTGEDALKECMATVGGFYHNDQTIRTLTHLEQNYAAFDGLNLTWECLEGIAKHNGPVTQPTETIVTLDREWPLELSGHAGLEAQIAAIADDIAYTAHDLDDGLRGGYFTFADIADLPLTSEVLAEVPAGLDDRRRRGEMHRRLVNRLNLDVLTEAQRVLAEVKPERVEDIRAAGRPIAGFGAEMKEKEKVVRSFLRANLYSHYRVRRVRTKAMRVVTELYKAFMSDPRILPTRWQKRIQSGFAEAQRARVVADYIAGMTDRYAIEEHKRLFDMDTGV